MADQAETSKLREEINQLQSLNTALDGHQATLQRAIDAKFPSIQISQLNAIIATFKAITVASPTLVIPEDVVNNPGVIMMHLAVVRMAIGLRIGTLNIMLSMPLPVTIAQLVPPKGEAVSASAKDSDVIKVGMTVGQIREPNKLLSFRRSFLVDVIGFAISLSFLGFEVFRQATKRSNQAPPAYDAQLKSLDKTKDNIQSLLTFIDEQKKQLQLSKSSLDALKTEEGQIHPLVEADRKVIDAVFAVQEQRNQNAQARERWIGFALGVVASLVAYFITSLSSKIIQWRRSRKA